MIPPHLSRARAASEWSGQRLTSTSSSPSQPVTAGDRRWRLTGGTPLWRDQLLFPAAWWTSPWDVEDNRPWELHTAGMRRCGVLRQSCCSVRPFACLPVCLSSCLSVCLSICLSVCPSVCLPACLYIYYVSACLYVGLPVCVPVCLPFFLSVFFLSVCLLANLPPWLSVRLFTLSIFVFNLLLLLFFCFVLVF